MLQEKVQARHEFKHSLNYGDYVILSSRIRHVLPHDRYIGPDGAYKVRSLYFDTPGDRALREKIDGVNRREKFRIRLYNNSPDFIRLEKKSKNNGLCYKRSEKLTSGEVEALLGGEYGWMLDPGRPLVSELYSKMRGELLQPKTLVEYLREPFVYRAGNVRITFDSDIRTGLYSTDFLNPELPLLGAGDELVLLEVKYDAFIPQHIVKLLQTGHRKASACSKYALCRVYG